MFVNRVTLAAEILEGPHLRIHDLHGDNRIPVVAFKVGYKQSYGSKKRRLEFWCKAFRDASKSIKRFVRRRDWVLVDGALYQTAVFRHPLDYHKEKLFRTEIWCHSVDIMMPPYPDDPSKSVLVPYSKIRRWRAFEEDVSRWRVPLHRARAILSPSEIDQIMSAEDEDGPIRENGDMDDSLGQRRGGDLPGEPAGRPGEQ